MKKVVKILIIFATLVLISVIIINVIYHKNKKIIVCIDPGHGGEDVGAIFDDRYEKDDTLKVAQLVKQFLEEQNITVVMTRNKDKTTSLLDRCKIANKKNSYLFASIHRNAAEEGGDGIEIWVNSEKNDKDISLANSILNKLQEKEIQINRGVKVGSIKGPNTDYYVLNNTKMPSCLIELGFITNEMDNKLFDQHVNDYAKAIADGIIKEIKVEN